MTSLRLISPMILLAVVSLVRADGVADNAANKVRPIPPKGIALAESDRNVLQDELDSLGRAIDDVRSTLKDKPRLLALLPDVQVFHGAVATALAHGEFFNAKDVAKAKDLLKQGIARAEELRSGRASWDAAPGLIVRGYVSKIDGSVQPYGLVVPASYSPSAPHRYRLDVWCHGRGETLSEVNFLKDRQTSPGEFTPTDAFVLHPYGRYCNANKLAGEIDLFEALDDIRKHYPIDENRLVMRGFSMGGAACWQFAVHYPSVWAAAAPGAGFSETPDFLKVFQNETLQPSWYEKSLWRMYDCTGYAANLFNCPTVAYSGEKDSQKQAADLMAKALADEGIDMVHVIGAGAGHHYTRDAKIEINRRIDSIVDAGRDPVPARVVFTTYTLRYNRSFWVQVDGLAKHWERARVEADLLGNQGAGPKIETSNVTGLTLEIPAGLCPLDVRKHPKVQIDGQHVEAPRPLSDRSWTARFQKVDGKWRAAADDGRLVKRHGLQGPIDDAFMDSFLMVRPTGPALNAKVGDWAATEMGHAVDHWRRQFRGDARIKDDKDVTDADIADRNLILWGDPNSNAYLAKIADKLPVQWTKDGVKLGAETHDAGRHVPVMIYPNPLNPKRYVVLNSGFTFREYDYLNNARQVPKLPDFAIVDVDSPPTSRVPGRIVQAGFFDEEWKPRTDESHVDAR
ncbi:MAG: prolyl oligopeptidase family serine peptidase [Paludisphaera borealis]|uniref:prolyl oligopeptidase family serine peptidase n=1 Tax=Paludisphaera borealis TaxID=1387353 RepID=UPI00284E7BF7|nr:prolyl oligopeptidase family serine peptidase [Paludisphaera borealis]MDR3622693.1 prolyl oligopeptidase family serine peptidase [Paludisphaera borealis]